MHATAQLIGTRSHQCDATATHTHAGTRAYVLLDGIGSSDRVREWTRTMARRLARAAAVQGAEAGLREVHAEIAAERDGWAYYGAADPAAVAVVAVAAPGGPLEVAWCGDARAYLLAPDGTLEQLTKDHNMRQAMLDLGREPDQYARNHVLSYLGDIDDHPAIGTRTTAQQGRLLLASDGAYEPLEDDGCDLATYLTGSPRTAARTLTTAAIGHATRHADNATVLVADLG